VSLCEKCNDIAEECNGLCARCLDADVLREEAFEEGRLRERADLRSWLGQQAGKANRDVQKGVHGAWGRASAFKEAADHLKPECKPSAKLLAKRAARK